MRELDDFLQKIDKAKILLGNDQEREADVFETKCLPYDEAVAAGFDEVRISRLKKICIEEKKNEIFTSGVLISLIKPDNADVRYSEHGKPFFVNKSGGCIPPFFNITHSAGKVICVFSDIYDIGADFEPFGRKISSAMAKKICTDSEMSLYNNFSDTEVAENWLLRLFTRKEAVSKLFGEGILMDFRKIEADASNVITEVRSDGYLSVAYRYADSNGI